MKKKVAVYANGFSIEPLLQVIKGIRRYAAVADFDVYVFLSFASYSEHYRINQGELNIYNLGIMDEYDGLIVLSTHLNSSETAVSICRHAKEAKVPVISVGMPVDDIPCVKVNNGSGMRDMITHLVEDHGVKRIIFIGGTPDHVDNIERIETTRQVLSEHGLELRDKDIQYADWGNVRAREIVDEVIASEEGLPDAFVCANDIMALAATTHLIELGYSIPGDVRVTGFDNISYGNHFYPALTTVDQNYEEVGYSCCRMIFDSIEGKECPAELTIPSLFVRAESCGCMDQVKYSDIRRRFCQYSYEHHLDSTSLETTERVLRQKIGDITDYSGLKWCMQDHYSRNHTFEGQELYIVLNAEYFEDAVAREEELFVNGYRDLMEAVVALKDGKIFDGGKTDRRELIPAYRKTEGEQHVYYITPLHYLQYNYGYMVFTDEPPIIVQDMLYPYLEKLQQSFKLLRINLRLDSLNKDLTKIYNRDPMTGLFNRLVYEDKANVLYEQCVRNNKPMMVMFVDINYMKRINDQYGHLHGDNAIKTVAGSIKYVLKEDWLGVRFGGDEFLIIGSDCDEDGAIGVRRSILSFLELKNNDGSQPYKISASCGFVITDPSSGLTLQDYVKEADNLMYKIKQEVHARDGQPRA